MKILEYEINLNSLNNNLEELADLNRKMIYEENSKLIDLLDFDDDSIFLEPTLFFYPKENKSYNFTTSLEQLMFGYSKNKIAFDEILVISDSYGRVNLPGYGYLETIPNSKFYLKVNLVDNHEIRLLDKNRKNVPFNFSNFKYVNESKIKIIEHQPEILSNYLVTYFNESVSRTVGNHIESICNGYETIKELSPHFAHLLEITNKEFCAFNSKMPPYSMAALFYFGTAFMNTNNEQHGKVFFIDDISHQGGHNLFYGLTFDVEKYLIPAPGTPLRNFTSLRSEARDVYGAFHGLFTYTAIIDTLSKFIENDNFVNKSEYIEATARLGFYMNKFIEDLRDLNNKDILTPIGFSHYEMFYSGYELIEFKYKPLYNDFDYSNQDYIFNFEKFLVSNKI